MLLLLLSACSKEADRLYSGPPLAPDQVASIKGTFHFLVVGAYGVNVLSVDGSGVADPVEVLPGEHKITVETFSCWYWCRGT